MSSRRILDSERRGFLGPESRQCCSPVWPVSVAPLRGINLTTINRTETGGLNLMMPGSFQLSKPCVLTIAMLPHSERTPGRLGLVSRNPTSLRLFRPDLFVPVINAHRPGPCPRCRQPGRIPTHRKSMFVFSLLLWVYVADLRRYAQRTLPQSSTPRWMEFRRLTPTTFSSDIHKTGSFGKYTAAKVSCALLYHTDWR